MTRTYGEPVEVRRDLVDGEEAPAQFLWRGRLYVVRAVLSHWVETGAWWSAPAARGLYGMQPAEGAVGVLEDADDDVWRVEAAAGRASPVGVYDLRLSWSTGSWSLTRIHD